MKIIIRPSSVGTDTYKLCIVGHPQYYGLQFNFSLYKNRLERLLWAPTYKEGTTVWRFWMKITVSNSSPCTIFCPRYQFSIHKNQFHFYILPKYICRFQNNSLTKATIERVAVRGKMYNFDYIEAAKEIFYLWELI